VSSLVEIADWLVPDWLIPFAILLGVLVTVHELGHFVAARACGVRVLKFSIGFGPPIGFGRFRLRWLRKGTEYVIAWIPLGGFVKMLGENPGEEHSAEAVADRAHSLPAQPLWKKLTIVLAGPAVNLVLPVIVFMAVLWVGMQRPAAVVGSVERGSPAAAADVRAGDRVVAVDGEPVAFWSDVESAIRSQPGAALRLSLRRDGAPLERELVPQQRPGLDELGMAGEVGWLGLHHDRQLAVVGVPRGDSAAARAGLRSGDRVLAVNGSEVGDWAAFATAYGAASGADVALRIARRPSAAAAEPEPLELRVPALGGADALGVIPAAVFVQEVQPDSPAAQGGLESGDLLIAVDGEPIGSFAGFSERVRASEGRALAIQYARDGETRETRVAPALLRTEIAEGVHEDLYRIGIAGATGTVVGALVEERVRNPLVALPRAVGLTVDMTGKFLLGLKRIVSGEISRKAIGGPIEIARQSQMAWQMGWGQFLMMLVLISINLGILNLLPIPVLDGGQAVLYTLEAALEDRFTMQAREIAQTIGFALLMSLMGLAFYNDLSKHAAGFIQWVKDL
jgi:regulator of sigma E protease